MDAMGTQRGIANLIRQKRAHYLLSLKENHKRFYRKVDHLFTLALEKNFQGMVYRKHETKDYGHARIEERAYKILPMMYLSSYKNDWRDISAFIQLKSRRRLACGKIEESVRYYITSIPFKKHVKMCDAIRGHWAVENNLHWKLDVVLRPTIYAGDRSGLFDVKQKNGEHYSRHH